MSANNEHEAMLKGIWGGLLLATAIGLVAGLIAAVGFWPRSAEGGFMNFMGLLLSGLLVGGLIGLVVGTSLAWHGGIIGSTLDRGDAAPIYGLLTGTVLGGSFGPVLGGVLGLLLGQFVGGVMLGVFLGPLVGIAGWEAGFWGADFTRGSGR